MRENRNVAVTPRGQGQQVLELNWGAALIQTPS